MKFLKENSYDIIKLFINQIGIAIFSMALYSAVSIAMPGGEGLSSVLEICISVFAILFYLILVYTAMWEMGSKDAIRVESGKTYSKPLKGFWISLAANIPNFLLCGAAILFMGLFLLDGAEWAKSIFAILNLLFGFIESMYLGVIINILPIETEIASHLSDVVYFNRAIAYCLMPVLPITTSTVAYILGSKNFKIISPAFKSLKKDKSDK